MSDRRGQEARSAAGPDASGTLGGGPRRADTVAVLIPTYHGSATIDATLASVAGQSRPPDEVVVVDDASTDDTVRRVLAWADRLPLVLVRNDTNLGIGPTRARGVAAASSDLVALLDHDDVWLPDHLETVLPLAADGHTIVASRCLRWAPGITVAADRHRVPAEHELADELLRHNYMVTGSVFPRRQFLAIGRPSTSRTVDDWETWIRLVFEQRCRVAVSPTPTILYRASATQASAGGDGCLPDEIELLERLRAEPAYEPHRHVLDAALRRRYRRSELVEAMALAAEGRHAAARRRFLTVAVRDRSWRGGRNPSGSLALRAAFGAVAPRRFLDRRARHLAAHGITASATGSGAHTFPAHPLDPSETPCKSSTTTTA